MRFAWRRSLLLLLDWQEMQVLYREVVMPRSELRTAKCYPSAEEINALPEKFRQYIHDLVSPVRQER